MDSNEASMKYCARNVRPKPTAFELLSYIKFHCDNTICVFV